MCLTITDLVLNVSLESRRASEARDLSLLDGHTLVGACRVVAHRAFFRAHVIDCLIAFVDV